MNDQETSTISRYLLGELAPAEMETLERRLLTEPGLFELAESVEDDVVDRYVQGEMSREEERRFERRLLPSRRIQERVAFARALAFRRRAERGATARSEAGTARGIPLLLSSARLAWAATLIAALAAGALAFQVAELRQDRAELQRNHAAAMAQLEEERQAEVAAAPIEKRGGEGEAADRLAEELSAARERIAELEDAREAAAAERRARGPRKIRDDAATVSLFLSLATRAADEPATLRLGDLGEEKDLELHLDLAGLRPEQPLVGTVFRGPEPVYRVSPVPVESWEGESMARLVLPRESLLEGRYRIDLVRGENGGALLGTYELSVTR